MERDTRLSELLIKIGIIGVLASLILPTIIKNIQDRHNVKVIKMQQKMNIDEFLQRKLWEDKCTN